MSTSRRDLSQLQVSTLCFGTATSGRPASSTGLDVSWASSTPTQQLGHLGSTSIEFAIFLPFLQTLCRANKPAVGVCSMESNLPKPQLPAEKWAEPPKRVPVLPSLALLALLHMGADGY